MAGLIRGISCFSWFMKHAVVVQAIFLISFFATEHTLESTFVDRLKNICDLLQVRADAIVRIL